MDDLERQCERLLASYRRDDAPDDAAVDRILGRLATPAAAAPTWMGSEPKLAPPKLAPRSRTGLLLVVAGVGLAAAAALVLWQQGILAAPRLAANERDAAAWESRTGEHSDRAVRRDDTTSPATARPNTAPNPDLDVDAAPAEIPPSVPSVEPSTTTAPRAVEAGTPRTPNRASAAAGASSATRSLALELEQIGAAESALRSGRIDRTLTLLDEYERSHPDGALAPEAAALRTIARCELGASGSTETARRWLRANPKATSRRRIEIACGLETADTAEKNSNGDATTPPTPGH